MKSKIFVALDVENKEKALEIVGDLRGLGACFKIGKQLFTSTGPELVKEIVAMGEDVFLDLKYHDIPNTVAKAGVAAAELGVKIFNVHASGGRKMMEAVREEMNKLTNPPLVLAVTILTSLGEEDIREGEPRFKKIIDKSGHIQFSVYDKDDVKKSYDIQYENQG